MTASQYHPYLSPEAYLEAEKDSPIKHEYIQGQIYAMAGASDAHVTITANGVALLRTHIRGTNCRIVQKLWNYCNVLRDDGVSYSDYVEQLTYLLFLKMADEQTTLLGKASTIPSEYNWQSLRSQTRQCHALDEEAVDLRFENQPAFYPETESPALRGLTRLHPLLQPREPQ
jgi:hypothetical protein